MQKKLLKRQLNHQTHDDWLELVKAATYEVVSLHHASLLTANHKYLLQYLDLAIDDEKIHQEMYGVPFDQHVVGTTSMA